MLQSLNIKNPKRWKVATDKESWYPYYAGFSSDFVFSLLNSMPKGENTHILDPWNGSGTTTTLANQLGFISSGYDLNPVMVIAAKAKLLSVREFPSLLALAKNIASKSKMSFRLPYKQEPLETWLAPNSARHFRKLEISLQNLLLTPDSYTFLKSAPAIESLSQLACFFYLALFRTLRRILASYYASNPTWVKRPLAKNRLRPTGERLQNVFIEEVAAMIESVATSSYVAAFSVPTANFGVASSCALPSEVAFADLVITSPPYCTRIDYAIATLPELTLLGYDPESDVDLLRRKLIGTSTVPKEIPEVREEWGRNCHKFLEKVLAHSSKASSSYYYKSHLQYFASMYNSIRELNRVTKPGGSCIMVVQDSYYKDIHNDLAQTLQEMFLNNRFHLVRKEDFISGKNMNRIHPGSKLYRTNTQPVESVICFQK